MNKNLSIAKKVKNDEFYTMLPDIEKEVLHYLSHFYGKTVFCNCDDDTSNFTKYFKTNFYKLGLKELIVTGITEGKRFQDTIDLLDKSDIVVTNPPFSQAREFIQLLMEHHKRFLIVGDLNWISYREIFPLIKNNQIWLGYNMIKSFLTPEGEVKKFGNKLWYTNLDIEKRHEWLDLRKKFEENNYLWYDNYDAINVNRIKDIPCDYDGVMGVPVTFLNRYNPNQFEIITLGHSPKHFTPMKKYEGVVRHNTDGTVTKKHIALNQCLTIGTEEKPEGIYYTAVNSDKYLILPYDRLLIRRKHV